MTTRNGFLAAASLAAMAALGGAQESRPASSPAADGDRELIEDFRVWARDHPETAARLKLRMDADRNGTLDEAEKQQAMVLLRERRAEMREWVRSRAEPAPGGAAAAGKAAETEEERARRLFDRSLRDDTKPRTDGPAQARKGAATPERAKAPPPRKAPGANAPEAPRLPVPAKGRRAVDKPQDRGGSDGETQRTPPPPKGR